MITYYKLPAKAKGKYIVWKKTVRSGGAEHHEAITGPISEAAANSKIQKLQSNG